MQYGAWLRTIINSKPARMLLKTNKLTINTINTIAGDSRVHMLNKPDGIQSFITEFGMLNTSGVEYLKNACFKSIIEATK